MSRRGHKKSGPSSAKSLPVESWPEADRGLWQRASRAGNVLESGGRASRWKPRTIKNVTTVYGDWLKWLRDDQKVDLLIPPRDRVTRHRVKSYIEHLERSGCSPATIQLHLQRLGQMMAAFTETKEFGWLFRAANRIKPTPVRNKREKLKPSYVVANLGFQLMQMAESKGPSWHHPPAIVFRDGLIVALLAYRPMRLSNLASIRIGEHLVSSGDGFKIAFGAEETKQRRPVEFSVPQAVAPYLRRYIDVYRPALSATRFVAEDAGNHLWVSRDGGPMLSHSISDLIKKRTKAAFGKPINPHLFRDCAATTIATDDPNHAFAIPGVLGHSSMATSERHYNQARMLEAAQHYQGVLAKQRRRQAA